MKATIVRSSLAGAFLAALCAMPTAEALAAVVSGTFSGIANDAQFEQNLPPVPTFADAPVAGTFSIDTGLIGAPQNQDPNFASYRLPSGAVTLSFTVQGQTHVFGNSGIDSAGTIYADPTGQALMFGANFFGSLAQSASLGLGSDMPGHFADALDLRSFHPATVDLRFVDLYFRLAPDVGARVAVAALNFDVPGIPEPGTAITCALGLGVVVLRLRRGGRGRARSRHMLTHSAQRRSGRCRCHLLRAPAAAPRMAR